MSTVRIIFLNSRDAELINRRIRVHTLRAANPLTNDRSTTGDIDVAISIYFFATTNSLTQHQHDTASTIHHPPPVPPSAEQLAAKRQHTGISEVAKRVFEADVYRELYHDGCWCCCVDDDNDNDDRSRIGSAGVGDHTAEIDSVTRV